MPVTADAVLPIETITAVLLRSGRLRPEQAALLGHGGREEAALPLP